MTPRRFLIAFPAGQSIMVATEAMDVRQEQKAMKWMGKLRLPTSRCVPLMAAVVLASLWLGGCGPGSEANLRSRSHIACSLEVDADYATVYDRIARRARWQYARIREATRQPGVTADLFAESQSATVTLWDSGGIGLRYRISARIHAIDSTRTKVELYAAGKGDRREARLWTAWATLPLEK